MIMLGRAINNNQWNLSKNLTKRVQVIITIMDIIPKHTDQNNKSTRHTNILKTLMNGLGQKEDKNIRNLKKQMILKNIKAIRMCFLLKVNMNKS